ncbi:homing endonuclease [Rhizobium phage RL38J1]|uniref:Homing endonuclease n=1 Tax=Rhizobium phage RL38J1 TaxID=2663232 RepID=A0A6B9J0Z6_9CAUD|nr:homing endonuclease [Rhizobium phage RL38J1]QGZ13899.1 homing endonuclease [Rhizobium phage RL38J1]
MSFIGFVYRSRNLANGKMYIGRKNGHPLSRENVTYYGSGVRLLKALDKYGHERFEREVLQICHSFEELEEAETSWLQFYNVCENPDYYNLTNHSKGYTGHRPLETRMKISEGLKGSKLPEEVKAKMRGPRPHIKGLTGPKKGSVMEKSRKKLALVSPEGNVVQICGLQAFSNEYRISRRGIRDLMNGRISSYRGWTTHVA